MRIDYAIGIKYTGGQTLQTSYIAPISYFAFLSDVKRNGLRRAAIYPRCDFPLLYPPHLALRFKLGREVRISSERASR